MPLIEVLTVGNTRLNRDTKKWEPFQGLEVDMELPHGGKAITAYQRLLQVNDDTLVNEANGDILYRTKKDKQAGEFRHYFSQATGILVNAWLRLTNDE